MAAGGTSESVQDALEAATMKVSQSHLLLSGIVEAGLHPHLQESAHASLEMLADAVTDLRDIAASLKAGATE